MAEERSEDEVTAKHDAESSREQENTDTSESMQPPAHEENATNSASDEQ